MKHTLDNATHIRSFLYVLHWPMYHDEGLMNYFHVTNIILVKTLTFPSFLFLFLKIFKFGKHFIIFSDLLTEINILKKLLQKLPL